MPKKVTTQDFIDRARAVHGDKYGYAFSVYQSTNEKVFIHCHDHGIFEQSPGNHLKGNGCASCYGNKKMTTDVFVKKAKPVHGNKYDYSKVDYINAMTNVKIICPKHGEFDQSPANHLGGKGCPKCKGVAASKAQRSTIEEFIEKAREVHGDGCDYSMVDYVNAATKVKIVCPEHGIFFQTPTSHLQGSGCPGCADYGFDRTKFGVLYVLRSDCGRYMKIGITHKPDQRYTQLSRVTPFSFKRIEFIEGPGDQIANLEKLLLSEYQPAEFTETFDGYSEWRLWDDSIREKLTEMI